MNEYDLSLSFQRFREDNNNALNDNKRITNESK